MYKKIFFLVFFTLCCYSSLFSQAIRSRTGVGDLSSSQGDSIPSIETKVILSGKTKYTDYKIFSHKRDTSYIDTTLTLQKEYKFNYLRKDNFEFLEFHNQGQTFSRLGYNFERDS